MIRGIGAFPVGLRWRIAGWLVAATLMVTAIVFVVVYRGTGAQLHRQIDTELKGDAGELARDLARSHHHSTAALAAAARAYVQDQPFTASSTLLFVLLPGAPAISNRPELFERGSPDEGESVSTQAEENRLSRGLVVAATGYSTLALADVGDLRLIKRRLSITSGPRVTVGVGEPLAPVDRAQRGVADAFVLAGVLALVGSVIASFLLGARLSSPLRRIAAVAAQVDGGELYPRIHDAGSRGDEIEVLANAFNHMLDRLAAAFAAQRTFVADASHELRTPLTVVRGQLEVLANAPDPTRAEIRRVEQIVQAEISRITRLVDDLLLLARSEQPEFLQLAATPIPVFPIDVWEAMLPVAERNFELVDQARGVLTADPDRLAQALRNLITNAIAHTAGPRGTVRMRFVGESGSITFSIEDDGAGIPVEQREQVFERFHRLDSARDRASGGAGLGLAIVRAIAEAHGGTVAIDSSPEGGARIDLTLPRFEPAARNAQPRTAAAPSSR